MQALRPSFDGRWGGFGGAPKFPQPMTLEFCLRQSLRGVPDALEMVVISLDRMAEGGIYDHVGGGFARYSTDGAWHVPHFEKMLYDNAQLVQLYTRTWLVTGDDRYRRVATETVDVPAAGDAASRGRVLLLPGRRLRRRRGQVLHVELAASWSTWWASRWPRASAPRPRATGPARTGARTCCGVRSRSRRWRASTASIPATSRPWWRTRAPSCSRRGTDACTPAPTTRCSRHGTRWRSGRWPKPAARSTNLPTSRRRRGARRS